MTDPIEQKAREVCRVYHGEHNGTECGISKSIAEALRSCAAKARKEAEALHTRLLIDEGHLCGTTVKLLQRAEAAELALSAEREKVAVLSERVKAYKDLVNWLTRPNGPLYGVDSKVLEYIAAVHLAPLEFATPPQPEAKPEPYPTRAIPHNPEKQDAQLREARAQAFEEAANMAATYGAPIMRDDAERGFYCACDKLRDEFRVLAAAARGKKP